MTDLDAIQAAVRRLSDRAELEDLVQRYAMAVDDHDIAAVAEMYTADASFVRRGRTKTGRAAVLQSLEASMRLYGLMIHIPQSLVIEWVDEDHARGAATGHAELAVDGQLVLAAFRYRDEYRREAQRWRFSRRELRFIYSAPASDLPSVFAADRRLCWPGEQPDIADLPESLPTWDLDAPGPGPGNPAGTP